MSWQTTLETAITRLARTGMDRLTLFGFFALTAMLVCYALE
jgi:hypothetical protein